jgi:hypothetical protein
MSTFEEKSKRNDFVACKTFLSISKQLIRTVGFLFLIF